jgi:hypothetical protein
MPFKSASVRSVSLCPALGPLAVNFHFGFAAVVAGQTQSRVLQVLGANVVEDADNAALEDGEAPNGIGRYVATRIFSNSVIDCLRACEHWSHKAVLAFAVSHEAGSCGDHLFIRDRAQVAKGNGAEMHGAYLAVSLNQGEHHFLVHATNGLFAALATLFFAGYIRFIRLNDLATAKPSATVFHGLTQTVPNEPSCFVGHAKSSIHFPSPNGGLLNG